MRTQWFGSAVPPVGRGVVTAAAGIGDRIS
ncbi:hypothetical protein NRB56_72990 [Nocardia sp. RB56]|uniref:Uncharacterized protein n=1 Tax=Nocardia aurantia TaxID=2585199 RepID=A0A7K0E0U7_9NOCA|nr:hypothetical protein [Nocardia aurantia]